MGKGLSIYFKIYKDKADPTFDTVRDLSHVVGMDFTARECDIDFKNGNYIPHRNLIFLGMAYHVAELHDIPLIVTGLGTIDVLNKYPDTSQFFVQEVSKIAMSFTMSETVIQVVNPVAGLDKVALLKLSKKLGILNIALKTSSCYSMFQENNEWGRGCGRCSHCQTRIEAYKKFRKKTKGEQNV